MMVFSQRTTKIGTMTETDKIIEDFLLPPPDSTPKNFVLRSSIDSLRDASGSSLDRSNNSSSTNTSWNSSCSCHSMASLGSSGKRSTFIFHKQPILPPMLCSSSRTEMKVYKMKAIEKEQKRKEKEKQRLISRVEAILSSVEVSPPAKTRHCKPYEQTIGEENDEKGDVDVEGDFIEDCNYHQHQSDDVTCSHSATESHTSHDDATSCHGDHRSNHLDDVTSTGSNIHGTSKEDRIDDTSSSSSSDENQSNDDVSSFHDNAYRSSLRNLLQKSMSLNQSGNVEKEKNLSQQETQEIKSGSESEEDVTGNTVIDARPDVSRDKDPEPTDSCQLPPKTEDGEFYSEEETLVESIVDSVLTEAKKEISYQNTQPCDVTHEVVGKELKNESPHNEHLLWGTPKVQESEGESSREEDGKDREENGISPCSVTNSQFFELHNQSTSTKVDMPLLVPQEQGREKNDFQKFDAFQKFETDRDAPPSLLAKAIEQPAEPLCDIRNVNGENFKLFEDGTESEQSFQSGKCEAISSQGATTVSQHNSSTDSPTDAGSVVELSGSICYDNTVTEACPPHKASQELLIETSNAGLTVLQPIVSDTISDITSMTSSELNHGDMSHEDMKENWDPAIETGRLSSLKRSSSFTLDQPSRTFESAVIEAVSQHFHGFQEKKQADDEEISPNPRKDYAAVKEKKLLQARVRRGSYTLDEPSPYLVKNKASLTIESGVLDDDVCSETTCETGPQDVKRKLDLVSDSEESSMPTSVKKDATKQNGTLSKAELNVANLCKILQDQHVQQMEMMKRRHEQQLQDLQKELIQGDNKMSLALNRVANPVVPSSHDVTVSPSLASTEYKDIQIGVKRLQEIPSFFENRENHEDQTLYRESDVSRVADVELTPNLHKKLCKLSAHCKGHLTRRLLQSNKVQEVLQIIRDTSRLILSLRCEVNESHGMDSITDMRLEDRLYTQLRSAMHNLHHIFFDISIGERMLIIAQSSMLEKMAEKLPKVHKPQKLSAATQKSLERKRLLSSSSPPQPGPNHGKVTHKEIKSKISHIWKSDPVKPQEKKSPPVKLPSNTMNHVKKPVNKASVTSHSKARSPMMSQPQPRSRTTKSSQPSHKKSSTNVLHQPMTLQASADIMKAKVAESQMRNVTSSQSRKTISNHKSSSARPASIHPSHTSSLKSQGSSDSTAKGKSLTSQMPSKGSKAIERKTAKGRKPAPLTNANKPNIL